MKPATASRSREWGIFHQSRVYLPAHLICIMDD
jgi:hypothetical protein